MSFWVWVTSSGWNLLVQSICLQSSWCHCSQEMNNIPLWKWTIFLYQFAHCGVSGLFPASGYHKQGNSEHSGTQAPVSWWGIICVYAQEWYSWVFRYIYFQFSEEVPDWFPEWFHQFSIPQAMEEWSSFSTFWPACAVTWVFILAILIGVRCCFDLYLYFLISKDFEHFFWSFSAFHSCSIVNSLFRYLPHFLIGLFGFLVVTFLYLLYIVDISPLSSVGIEKIFLPIGRLPLCPIYYVLCLTKVF